VVGAGHTASNLCGRCRAGGLAGSTASESFYVVCDSTINTVVQSGEVRMEVGVALQFPAEFVASAEAFPRASVVTDVASAA
jgi:phage tail sheath protein FI